jgi:hypothetical protein
MPLREVLGDDVRVVHRHVDDLLNSEDALMVFVDGNRAVSYVHGFAASPSQLELLAVEIERAVRRVTGRSTNRTRIARDDRRARVCADERLESPDVNERCTTV